MRILVTGGTGVVGTTTVTELLSRGHTVRLVSRHASKECRQWPAGVEAFEASITDPVSLRGAADGCQAVIHLAGIVSEDGPEQTFEKMNVEGTRAVVGEAEAGGVVRFVYVSSLGAERGQSPYHKSKLAGEGIALASRMDVTVVRLANVYGAGDAIISLLIKMIRMLPIVPAIDGGNDEFQPMWTGDAAKALASCAERGDLGGQALDVAGPDLTCMNDLIHRVRGITGRQPFTIPVTGGMAVIGARIATMLGADIPLDAGQITMLEEGNVIAPGRENALTTVLGVRPTSLTDGLKLLADSLPEQLPEQGVGALRRKRVWADIAHATESPEQLFARFRENFSDATPWSMNVGEEPGTSTVPEEHETLTMALPLRGNVQVRVEELSDRSLTLVTLQGHPLAGAVRFLAEQREDALRFEVQVYERAADIPDWLIMRTVGQFVQTHTWKSIVEYVVKTSGGECSDGIHVEIDRLGDAQTKEVEKWISGLVTERKREENQEAAEQGAELLAPDAGTPRNG